MPTPPRRVLLLLCVSGVAACQGDAGGDDPFGPGGLPADAAAGGAARPEAGAPPADDDHTGLPRVDRLIDAAAACGEQSPRTTPAGWQLVLTGSSGCTLHAPPDFTPVGAGTQTTAVQLGDAAALGVMVLAGVPEAGRVAACTPDGLADFALDVVRARCPAAEPLYFEAYTEVVAGVPLPVGDLFWTCAADGHTTIGYFNVSVHGTTPLCELLIIGAWMPEAEVESTVCTLTQIMASLQCPTPGGEVCIDAECAADCRARGFAGGACHEDACVCQ